jgi:hypothetical protein
MDMVSNTPVHLIPDTMSVSLCLPMSFLYSSSRDLARVSVSRSAMKRSVSPCYILPESNIPARPARSGCPRSYTTAGISTLTLRYAYAMSNKLSAFFLFVFPHSLHTRPISLFTFAFSAWCAVFPFRLLPISLYTVLVLISCWLMIRVYTFNISLPLQPLPFNFDHYTACGYIPLNSTLSLYLIWFVSIS